MNMRRFLYVIPKAPPKMLGVKRFDKSVNI